MLQLTNLSTTLQKHMKGCEVNKWILKLELILRKKVGIPSFPHIRVSEKRAILCLSMDTGILLQRKCSLQTKCIKITTLAHPISRGIWTELLEILKMNFKKASNFKYQIIFLPSPYLLPLIYTCYRLLSILSWFYKDLLLQYSHIKQA